MKDRLVWDKDTGKHIVGRNGWTVIWTSFITLNLLMAWCYQVLSLFETSVNHSPRHLFETYYVSCVFYFRKKDSKKFTFISWTYICINTILGLHRVYSGKIFTLLFTVFDILWPDDAICQHRSTLAQLMACWLTAPIYCLNQCWHIINRFFTFTSDQFDINTSNSKLLDGCGS